LDNYFAVAHTLHNTTTNFYKRDKYKELLTKRYRLLKRWICSLKSRLIKAESYLKDFSPFTLKGINIFQVFKRYGHRVIDLSGLQEVWAQSD